MAESVRLVTVEDEGRIYRDNAKEMVVIFVDNY